MERGRGRAAASSAQGVRVDIASDSVTDLQRGESARWDASVYVDDAADDVVGCIVTTTVS
jgi:hypothetical protein